MRALTPVDLTSVAVSLMRVRGVHCKARYAEAFAVENGLSDFGSDYSVN